jgi:hypothetical protein
MSRYLVNKFMYRVNRDEVALTAYVDDPATFVANWERTEGPRLSDAEQTSGHQFSDEERTALIERDYAKLYALGAHPFMLWSFAEAVWAREIPSRDLMQQYREKTSPFGYPDFGT